MKNKLVILTGPTAVGKTELSIKLAKKINGEIISADSMQVYKDLNIGSAKVTPLEMDGVPHHLIDILNPTEDFNVFLFKKYSEEALNKIYANNHIPIIVGGTGFYIQALLYDISFNDENNNAIRAELESIASKENGAVILFNELNKLDPDYAKSVHINNTKRIIRALEYIKLNNELFSVHNEREKNKISPYDFNYFVLYTNKDNMYDRINKRVDIMVANGLVDEVKKLKDLGLDKSYNSMQGIGYKEILDYLDGKYELNDAIEKIKLETRHFAKRQMTWFRREKEVDFINKDIYLNDEEILEYIIGEVYEK